MRAERLFRALGLVDPALVEEALAVRRRPWRRCLALAACAALVLAIGIGRWGTGETSGSAAGGGGGPADCGFAGSAEDGAERSFLSCAGPVMPLAALENPGPLTAERTVIWDLAPGAYFDGEPRQWGAAVTDAYVLRNPSEADVSLTALYPFAGTLGELETLRPRVTVNGEAAEPALYAGPYSGGFQSTFGAEVPDTMNLEELDSWTDYQTLLESGAYLEQALADAPVLDIPAAVYEFSDFAAPHEEYQAATQAISFAIDPENTTVLTYGINGMEWDGAFRRYSYFVPDGMRNEPDCKMLIVLGEDIGPYTLQGYRDGGCDQGGEIEGVSCTVTRRETTLDAVLDQLCRYHQARYGGSFDTVPFPLYRGAAAELLEQYGLLSETPMDRYSDGRLDDILGEVLSHDRVLYLAFPLTVPAGGSAEVSCALWKAPSYDFACTGSEDEGLQAYGLAVNLGTTLPFTRQSAVLVNAEGVEITGQNFGFAPEGGTVELDLEEAYYYLEIRPKDG